MDQTQALREERLIAEGRENILASVMKAEGKGQINQLPYQNYLIRQVLEGVAKDIKDDIAGGAPRAYKKFAQYLGTIQPELAALRAIQAVLGVLFREGGADIPQPLWKRAAYAAGSAVYSEYLMQHFKGLSPALFNSLAREYSRSMTRDERMLLSAFKGGFKAAGYEAPTWAFGDIEQVGSYILDRLVQHRFLESWSRTEVRRGKAYTVRYLMLDEHLRSASLTLMDHIADLPRVAGPLIERPLDWDAETNQGGGFHTPAMQAMSAYAVQGKGPRAVAPQVVAMLNALQHVEWQINAPVLDAVRQVAARRDFGDVVSPIQREKPERPEGLTEEQHKAWKGEARAWYTEKKVRAVKHLRSQKVFREAHELSQYPTIWFTYYADFRGRAYTRSASVSPQGTDLEKGLLRLKNGKPLDSASSVRWFKAHGANRYGLDKLSVDDRVAWVDAQHAWLVELAADPVAHADRWVGADSPVQFLAWVLEYAAWVADPSGFRSHLAMAQDGTCNGLQNFSALMRDAVGGAATNLTPGPTPRDIYLDVARRVTELLEAMPPSKYRDAWLAHGIGRKVTKRTTMTLPYGCTRYACSLFVTGDYLEKEQPAEIAPADYGEAANFLSHVIWRALDDVVVKAREVMLWLQGWAKHAASTGQGVHWVAPSGLFVQSEYARMRVKEVRSTVFKSRLKLYTPTGLQDLKKVANAIAPNFVHSLDSSHMARVVLRAEAEGMTPVTIHDDFGVHATDTEKFHAIIREEFVAMYEGLTILEDMAKRTGYEVPPPTLGSLDLRLVLQSPYFFS